MAASGAWAIAAVSLGPFAASLVRENPPEVQKPRLLDQVRAEIRKRHYRRRTEKAYVAWVRRFILFHGKRHPTDMGAREVSSYLSHLAVTDRVSASTQNQALSALLFLDRQVLGREIEWVDGVVRAKRPVHLPVALTREEVRTLLGHLHGVEWVRASLLYGSDLRLLECCRLRVKDLDLAKREILVRNGKGAKDRITLLPAKLVEPLAAQLGRFRGQHDADLANGAGSVELPWALERKYPRGPRGTGAGSGSSRQRRSISILPPDDGATISTNRSCIKERADEFRCDQDWTTRNQLQS